MNILSRWVNLWYNSFEILFMRSWWVLLFIVACYFCYEQGLAKHSHDFAALHRQYTELLKKREEALAQQELLSLQINSQSDHEYIELTLMKGLGLVPEGSKKVFFTSPTPDQPDANVSFH